MRLGTRSKEILELLAVFSLETLEAAITLPRLYKVMSYSSERSFNKTTELLKRNGLIHLQDPEGRADWVSTLTSKGRSTINNDIDPEQLWSEPWDGNWRLMSFDLPSSATAERQALRKWLESYRFGRLQGSVWITPRNLGEWTSLLKELEVDSKNSIAMCGKLGDEKDQSSFIHRAWDFAKIGRAYEEYLRFVRIEPSFKAAAFREWFLEESSLWNRAFVIDPFLPRDLWTPELRSSYLGPAALQERNRRYKEWKAVLFE